MGKYILLLILFLPLNVWAHKIDSVFGEFKKFDNTWELHLTFDVALSVPELRSDTDAPQPTRAWLVAQSHESHALMRKEAERFVKSFVEFTYGENSSEFEISFPDFEASPPKFPELLNGGAYFNVVLIGSLAEEMGGEFRVRVSEEVNPVLVFGHEVDGKMDYFTIPTGSSKVVFYEEESGVLEYSEEGMFSLLWLGFLHVAVDGLDHLLFIVALFFMVRSWRGLVMQSLVFTVAHCLTLGLCVSGVIGFGYWPTSVTGWVEPLIALSIVYLGVENLLKNKTTPMRLSVVFVFGLVHGFGFASSLGALLGQMDSWIMPLVMVNLGIELAQVTILVLLWCGTILVSRSERYDRVRQVISLMITITAGWMVIERIV